MTDTRAPSPLFYIAMVAAIALVTTVAILAGVSLAGKVLAVMMAFVACLRLVLPTGTIPHIRGRVSDVLTLAAFAAALWYLSSWGDLTPVA